MIYPSYRSEKPSGGGKRSFRWCVLFRKAEINGKEKVRCQHDNSIRNQCKAPSCPHFQPTLLYKILNWWRKRDE